jgi:hypothetical protein
MGSYKHPQVFGPLDLEIIDRVYDAAWAELEAREPFRDRERDEERRDELRKLIMDNTGTGQVEFDALYERVLASMPQKQSSFTPHTRAR